MSALFIGKPFPYGTRANDVPMPRVVNLPPGVLRYRIRERLNDITTIVLKFSDRVERRYLKFTKAGDWEPEDYSIATNIHKTPGAGSAPAPKRMNKSEKSELDALVGRRLLTYHCRKTALTYVRDTFTLDLFFDGFGDPDGQPANLEIICNDGKLTVLVNPKAALESAPKNFE